MRDTSRRSGAGSESIGSATAGACSAKGSTGKSEDSHGWVPLRLRSGHTIRTRHTPLSSACVPIAAISCYWTPPPSDFSRGTEPDSN